MSSVTGNHTVVVSRGLQIDGKALPAFSVSMVTETQINPSINVPSGSTANINGLLGIAINKIASMWFYSPTMDCTVVITTNASSYTINLTAGIPWEWDNQSGFANPLLVGGSTTIHTSTAPTVQNTGNVNGVASVLTTTAFQADIELGV